MGINYLPNNKSWSEITRDERYYCAELFQVSKEAPEKLVNLIREKINDKIPDSDNLKKCLCSKSNWEIGYEVCFYRDVIHIRSREKYNGPDKCKTIRNLLVKEVASNYTGQLEHFPMKRTFDLCLFAHNTLIIIEAKAQQRFTNKQVSSFQEDKILIPALCNGAQVAIVGLYAESRHNILDPILKKFDATLSWGELSKELPVILNHGKEEGLDIFDQANRL